MTISNSSSATQAHAQLPAAVQAQLGRNVSSVIGKAKELKQEQLEKGMLSEKTLKGLARSTERPALPPPNTILSKQELTALIQKMIIASLDQQAKSQTESTKITQDQLQDLSKENIKKIKDIAAKTAQSNVGSIVAKVFGWIAAIVAVVAAVALAVVSFGAGSAAIGAALLVGAAITTTVMILSETGVMDKLNKALAGPLQQMYENGGMDKQQAKMAAQITAQIIIAVAILAVDISLAVLSGGASAAKAVTSTMQKIAKAAMIVTRVAQAGSAVVQVGGAAAGTTAAVYKYEATMDRAHINENKAYVARLQALLEQEQETLREVLQDITKSYTEMDTMMKDMHSTNKQMLSQWASA